MDVDVDAVVLSTGGGGNDKSLIVVFNTGLLGGGGVHASSKASLMLVGGEFDGGNVTVSFLFCITLTRPSDTIVDDA